MASSSNPAPSLQRKSKGRQKVNLAKMENQSNLQVTFSKRRAGLFKKASELCTLCGAEAAMVVFSPADKPYCFAHPNVNTLLDRFAPETTEVDDPLPSPGDATSKLIIEAHRNSTIRELNLELTQLESVLRVEKKRTAEIEEMKKAGVVQRWYPGSFDKFSREQLCLLKEAVMGFQKSFEDKVQRDMVDLNSASTLPVTYGGNPNCNFWQFGASAVPHSNTFPQYGNASLGFAGVGGNDISAYSSVGHPMYNPTGQAPAVYTDGVFPPAANQRF